MLKLCYDLIINGVIILPTRKLQTAAFETESVWWTGPSWLSHDKESWPLYSAEETIPEDCLSELRKNATESVSLLASIKTATNLEEVIPVNNFSNYNKLVRVTA